MESDKFLIQGGKMKTNHAKMIKSLTSAVTKENIDYWTKAKKELNLYAEATNEIANCCNFNTSARPPIGEPFHCANLDFTLSIPADVKEIAGC